MAVAKGPIKANRSRSGASAAYSRRKSASTAAHTEAQNAIYVAPWCLLVLIGILGQVLWILWGDKSWQWITQIGMLASTIGVAYAGWLNTKARSALALWHTVLTIVGTGLWLTACSETGMFALEHVSWAWWRMPVPQHQILVPYILGGISMAVCWNIRQGIHARDAKDAAIQGDVMDEWGEAGFPGVKGRFKVKNEFFNEGTLVLPRGMTLKQLQTGSAAIESALDFPPNSLTLYALGRGLSSRRVKARVMKKDPLAAPTYWRGVDTNPKLTLFDPIKEGMRADGEPSTVFVAKPEGAKHFLVQGMTGSGKTEGQKSIILECAYRGAVQIVIDIVSGVQMFGSIAPALQWLITDEGEAKAVLRRLASDVIPARMKHLARERKRTWDPSSSLRFLRVHIEEAWSLLDADELMDIAVTARKAGVQLVVSLQRASHDQLNTTVREQLGTRMCYGLGGQFGTMILDEEVLDAGANPVQWKDEQPGMHYLTRGGLSILEKATPTRSLYDGDGSPVKFGETAAQVADRISEMDVVTAQSFGPLWTQHISPVEVVRRAEAFEDSETAPGVAPQTVPRLSRSVAHPAARHPSNGKVTEIKHSISDVLVEPDMGTDDSDIVLPHQLMGEDFEQTVLDVCLSEDGMQRTVSGDGLPPTTVVYKHEDTDPDIEGTADDNFSDIPDDLPRIAFTDNKEKVSRVELGARMDGRFDELRNSGPSIVHGGHFVALVLEAGYTRTLVYKYFDQWVEEGKLVKLDDGSGWLFVRQ